MLSKDLSKYLFDRYDGKELVKILQSLVVNNNNFVLSEAEYLDNMLESYIEQYEQHEKYLSNWVISLSGSHSMLARFLYARFVIRLGSEKFPEALKFLMSIVESSSVTEPFIFLHIVRLLVRMKRYSDAAEILKRALSLAPPYSFFIKCEKLLHRILTSGELQFRKSIRIAILGSSTTSFLVPVLQATCFRFGIYICGYEGLYGNFRQEILDPASGLHEFRPDAVVILLNHRDLNLSPTTNNNSHMKFVEELRGLWGVLQKISPSYLIQVGFDMPPYGALGTLEDILPSGRSKIINMVNSLLSEDLPQSTSFFDINRVALCCGDKFRSDVGWYQNKQYPSLEALPVLAWHFTSHLRAAFGYSAKVLVLDLDNTLWGGVIGEDGLSGITIGPPLPDGEGYLDLQNYFKELKERGVLLAVCSKNNREDAELPFNEHESMILKLNDFILFKANWQDKVLNIQEIAQELSLGLDSFVFLDDNPVERAWVRSNLSEVIVPECGNTPWEMLESLRKGMYFESTVLTEEDTKRHEFYQSNLERKNFKEIHPSIENFLIGLGMVAESAPIDSMTISRVTQLINKTNQFNLTTKRYSEEEMSLIYRSSDWWSRCFKLKDKFGDHGIVGVILAEKRGKSWHIDTWLMSCRVIGQKMEDFMKAELLNAARTEGVKKVTGHYIPTEKNHLVKNMYIDLGFEQDELQNHFMFHITDNKLYKSDFFYSEDNTL